MINLKKKKALIVGPGSMGKEYYRCLKEIGLEVHVIGRSKKSFTKFNNIKNIFKYTSFKDFTNSENSKDFDIAIVSVSVEALYENTMSLLETGIKKILIEKPGSLSFEQLQDISCIAKRNDVKIFIAYNRRYYQSIQQAIKIIEDDGGALSCHFDFTEWESSILDSGINKDVIGRWFFANSTHVLDTVFFIIGKPIEIQFFGEKKLKWHDGNSIYVGSGISNKGTPFSFHSNWNSPGRWNIEIMTSNHKIILCPTEDLKLMKKNSVNIEEFKRDKIDEDFKPGLLNQVKDVLKESSHHLCSIDEQISNWSLYNKLFHKRKI